MPIPHLRQQCQWNGYSEWLLKNRIFHTLFCKVYFSGSERHLFTSIAGRPREDFVSVFTTCMSWVLSVLLLKTSVYIVNVMLWPIQYVWWCFLWPSAVTAVLALTDCSVQFICSTCSCKMGFSLTLFGTLLLSQGQSLQECFRPIPHLLPFSVM